MQSALLKLLGLGAFLLLTAAAVTYVARTRQSAATSSSNAALIADEERIQSVAHALIRVQTSVLNEGAAALETLLEDPVKSGGFPLSREAEAPLRPGFTSCTWRLGEPAELDAGALCDDLERFLESFEEIEDLRFKLGDARASDGGDTITGKLKLRVIGRHADGRREWVRGVGKIIAVADGKDWRATKWHFTDVSSTLAARDPFVDVSDAAGFGAARVVVDPAHFPSDPAANNGAVAVSDVDGDGFLDVLVTGRARNLLFMNRGGVFEPAAGDDVALLQDTAAQVALFIDHDQDGDDDVFLCTWDKRHLLLTREDGPNGSPRYVDTSDLLGETPALLGNSLAAADVNMDGRPDVFVGIWSEIEHSPLPGGKDPSDNGRPNLLFVSQPDGGYAESAEAWGIRGSRWSHAAQFADVNGDRRPDLYVANDYAGGNKLYLHEGKRFRDRAEDKGVLDRGWTMGVSFGDLDADGDLDLHVTRMSSTAGARIRGQLEGRSDVRLDILALVGDGNKIYGNDGEGGFEELRFDTGELSGGWAFGGGFADLDDDGWLDLYAPNGFRSGQSMCDT